MLIASLGIATAERSGDWHYRMTMPMAECAKHDGVWTVDGPHIHRTRKWLLENADVMVVNMVNDVDFIPWIAKRRERGQVTIFEVNDIPRGDQSRWCEYISHYDAVQFSTDELQRRFGKHAKTSVVFRNMIYAPATLDRKPHAKTVIGWGGSIGHKDDLATVAGPLTDFVNSRDDVELALMADSTLTILFSGVRTDRIRLVSPSSVGDWYKFLQTVDIGIAPLNDTDFNRCRSDVKYLEYVVNGVYPVVQDLEPYRNTYASKMSTAGGLVALLSWLVDSPDHVSNKAIQMRDQAMRTRQAARAAERVIWYRSLCKLDTRDVPVLESSTAHGRHIELDFGDYEQEMWHGLKALNEKNNGATLLYFYRAGQLQPGNYQPHVFSSMVAQGEQRLTHLRKAKELQPDSLYCKRELGDDVLNSIDETIARLRASTGSTFATVPAKQEEPRRHPELFMDIPGGKADAYRVLRAFGVSDPGVQAAVTRLLYAKSDAEDFAQQLVHAMTSLERSLQMRAEEVTGR